MKNRKFYYGWWIVLCAVLIRALTVSPIYSVAGVFIVPVTEEFGISRAAFTAHISICMLMIVFSPLLISRLMKRFALKPLILGSSFIIGLCFIMYATARAVWQFYLASVLIGLASIVCGSAPVSLLISNWFGPESRGKALGIAMAGSGLGSMGWIPVISAVNENFGWRWSYWIFAGCVFAVLIPILAIFLYPSPQSKGLDSPSPVRAQQTPAETEGRALHENLKNPALIICVLGAAIIGFVTVILNNSGYACFCSFGFEPAAASSLMSLSAAVLIGSKILTGTFADRFGALAACIMNCLFMTVSYILCALCSRWMPLAYPAAIMFGIGNAVSTVCLPLTAAKLFGKRDYASHVAILDGASFAGQSLAAVFPNFVFDMTGSYIPALLTAAVLTPVVMAMMGTAYRFQAKARC